MNLKDQEGKEYDKNISKFQIVLNDKYNTNLKKRFDRT